MKGIILLHIIDNKTDKILAKPQVSVIPNVDEEVRLVAGMFKVVHIVHVYDEFDVPFERVNIGVEKL